MTQHNIRAPYVIYLGDTTFAPLAKTGMGLAYWRPERCLGQMREAGCVADLGLAEMSVPEAVAAGAQTLVIGTALIGGQLPRAWFNRLIEAMEAGLDIASGLHEPLGKIEELARVAAATGRTIHDVRQPPGPLPIATGAPRSGRRLLAMGTDCAVGKKYTALALHREMVARGMQADFRATGQTGILIDGTGVCVDAVISDFLAGAIEAMTPAAAPDHWDVIEGQGALVHPAYAGVTLGLLHGAQPTEFVVCHEAGREELSGFPGYLTGKIEEIIALTCQLGGRVSPQIRCVGLSINTSSLSEAAARDYLERMTQAHSLPACDPVRFGVGEIVDQLS